VRQSFHVELDAGQNPLHWDGRDATGVPQPAGVHFVRAWIRGSQLAKAVVLLN